MYSCIHSGIFDNKGRVKQRRKWTDEEKNAIKAGVRDLGLSRWADIKNLHAEILRNRTR